MPSKTLKQHNMMAGVCKGKIKGTGIPKKVACDFMHADKGKKFESESEMNESKIATIKESWEDDLNTLYHRIETNIVKPVLVNPNTLNNHRQVAAYIYNVRDQMFRLENLLSGFIRLGEETGVKTSNFLNPLRNAFSDFRNVMDEMRGMVESVDHDLVHGFEEAADGLEKSKDAIEKMIVSLENELSGNTSLGRYGNALKKMLETLKKYPSALDVAIGGAKQALAS